MSYLYCDTQHLINHSTYIPSLGPRQVGFSNIISPFASDDLYDLSDEDISEEETETEEELEADTRIRDLLYEGTGKSYYGANLAKILDETEEGSDGDSSQDSRMDVAVTYQEPIQAVVRPNYKEELLEHEEADSSSDDSDGEEDEYRQPVKIQPVPSRRRPTIHTIQKVPRARPQRFNNTLPITFVLALPPYRNQYPNISRSDGQMTEYQFSLVVYAFINGMSEQKQYKSIINHELAVFIRRCMDEGTPESECAGTFKYWARKMFSLADDPAGDRMDGMGGKYLVHDNRRVAVVEDFYRLLTRAHAGHGGRDKVMRLIRQEYSYLPKELVGKYTAACPRCQPEKAALFFEDQVRRADADDRTAADFPPACSTAQKRRAQELPDASEDESEGGAYQYSRESSLTAAAGRQVKRRPAKLRFIATPDLTRRGSDSSDASMLLSIPPTPLLSCDSGVESEAVSPISQYLDVSSNASSATVTPLFSPQMGSGWSIGSNSISETNNLFDNTYKPSANHISIESMIDPILQDVKTGIPISNCRTGNNISSNAVNHSTALLDDQPGQHQAFGKAFASARPHYNALNILLNEVARKDSRQH